jgi:cytosine/adenosine deaminase-related metal-dependent hydrolase
VYEDDERFVARLSAEVQQPVREALARQVVSVDASIALFEALNQRYGTDGRIRVQLAPTNLHWCSDAVLERVADVSRRHEVPMHMHLLETRYQKEYARRRTGTTALRHLERLGVLGPRLTLGHGVWLEDDDIDCVAATGTCICHNASSNLRLASGIAPLARFLESGATVGIGLDEAGINDDRDFLQEMRLVLRLHRQPGIETRKPTSNEILSMATKGGAATTPFKDCIGRLDPGMQADMVVLDWGALAYPYLDAGVPVVDAVIHLARTRHVDEVVIAGETVYKGGRFTKVDRDAVLTEIADRFDQPLTADETARRELAKRLEQPIHDFYRNYCDPSCDRPFYASNARNSD